MSEKLSFTVDVDLEASKVTYDDKGSDIAGYQVVVRRKGAMIGVVIAPSTEDAIAGSSRIIEHYTRSILDATPPF